MRDSYAAREDRKVGEVAKAVRTEQVVAKQEKLVHEQPVRIEPAITVVPRSDRAEKEKQQSLFAPPAGESDLPAIGLLDPPLQNQGNRFRRDDRIHLAPDREETGRFRRFRGRGGGAGRPGDHALRDRAPPRA